ncbi:hypothetical protein SAMN05660649_00052 [Desulfotomaculum arcticum]|uniref:Lipoprotein n=1 Tax=Desulfotruncus arcticus DSM 17038 TaxID=1121424 RepID=A0A1I2MV44_9FIRM|nr:hypothetical protein [Desulfotruncus arcticus]SFF93001.1 hypothetical protein SAMN05660649_00052 [Desulfotomaculum arcticum] [Desulfotruncus arcticus DSM 17038]
MKLNRINILFIALISVLVIGCSNGTQSGTQTPQKAAQENTAADTAAQQVALPEEQPALFGKVKDIVGNEVIVFKGEVAQNEESPKQDTPKEEPVSDEAQDKMQSLRADLQSGKITPEQAREEMQKLGLQPGQAQNRANSMNFTDETETFIIPVGTPIVTMQRGSNGANQVGLTEIKKDTILRIWKTDDTVSFVQVMSGSGAMGNRQGAGGQTPGGGGGMQPGMGGVIINPGMGGGTSGAGGRQ